jgi:EAL domain-containing protein (putative c-di-GMP-specific phosphodiesterase class I)
VAEGVEKEEQLQFLAENGCGLIQGYLTGKPMLPEQAIELLKSGRTSTAQAAIAQ